MENAMLSLLNAPEVQPLDSKSLMFDIMGFSTEMIMKNNVQSVYEFYIESEQLRHAFLEYSKGENAAKIPDTADLNEIYIKGIVDGMRAQWIFMQYIKETLKSLEIKKEEVR